MFLRVLCCSIQLCLPACWAFLAQAHALDWTPQHHLVEVDNCHQINLDQNTGAITITAICKPNDKDWFFKIWSSGKPAYILDQKLSRAGTSYKQVNERFDFSELSKTRRIFEFRKSDRLKPQMVFRDKKLTDQLINKIRSETDLSLLITTNRQYVILDFPSISVAKSDFEWRTINNDFSNSDIKKKKSKIILELLEGQRTPNIQFYRCKPDGNTLQIDQLKFVQNIREANRVSETCILDLIQEKTEIDTLPVFGTPSKNELELEGRVWELIIAANKLARDPTSQIQITNIEKFRRPEIRHFILNQLIPLILDKKLSISVAVKLDTHLFPEDDAFKYALALHLNCSSFQEKLIEEGQALTQALTSKLSAIEFAKGRILFAISRENIFKGIGYNDGVNGLIGEVSASDQCVNSTTMYSNFLKNSPTVAIAKKRLFANLNLIQITQKMIANSVLNIEFPTTNPNENDPVLKLINAYKLSLFAIQQARNSEYQQALETWDLFLAEKYGPNVLNEQVMPGDREKYLQLLALLNSANSERPNIEIERLIKFARDQFVMTPQQSDQPRDYLGEFWARESSLDVLDATINLLAHFPSSKPAQETIFLLLQRRFMDPETMALTRRYRASSNLDLPQHLATLLNEREPAVNQFYQQLSLLETSPGSRRKILRKIHEQAEDKFPDYFWKQGNTEQLLTRDSIVVNPVVSQSDELTPLIVMMSTVDSWELLEKVWQQNSKEFDSGIQTVSNISKNSSYDMVKAVEAYASMFKMDNEIREISREISDLTTGRAVKFSDVSMNLRPGQALMMISISETMQNMSVFAIAAKEHHTRIINKSSIKNCLNEFEGYAREEATLSHACARLLNQTLNPRILLPNSDISKVNLVLNGEAKNLPFAATPVKITSRLTEGQMSENDAPKYRGLKIRKELSTEIQVEVERHLIEDLTVSHYPFVNMLTLEKTITTSNYRTLPNRKFVGLAVTKMPRRTSEKAELAMILKRLPDLEATQDEIKEVGYEFAKHNRIILNNKDATIRKLLAATKNQYPFLLSFATHAIKSNERNNDVSSLVLYGENSESISLLDPNSIVDYGLGAENIFLSACETYSVNSDSAGLGNTLVSSFLLNGSRSILTSNLPVEDSATKKLMTMIARDLVTGKFPQLSKSFQKSVKALQNSEYAHPRFWSGFRVVGY